MVSGDPVFVWRSESQLKAYSANCPHLSGPLDQGIITDGVIRCPWHHACFNLATGDATAAPAFDALREYPVVVERDHFTVRPAEAQAARQFRDVDVSLGTMAIVGGGAAGFGAADALRNLGWRGGISVFSDETDQPYDRTLLTKDYLEGAFGDDRLSIAQHSLTDLGVDFRGGVSVQAIDTANQRLRLATGDELAYTKLLLATGAAPRRPDFGRRSAACDDAQVATGLPAHSRQC